MTMIGAIALDGFRGLMTVDSGTGIDVFQAFDKAVATAMELITGDDIRGWFKHCGYSVIST
jgi:hypothetical protein